MSHRGSRLRCCVKGCLSKSSEKSDISFHQLPPANSGKVTRTNLFGKKENVDRLAQWLKVLKIKNPRSTTKVCSLHFKKTDFRDLLPELPVKRPYLVKTAVPSLNLPMSDREQENEKRDHARLERLINRRLLLQDENPCPLFMNNSAPMADNTACFGKILQESQTENVDIRQCASDDVGHDFSSNDQPFAKTNKELVIVNIEKANDKGDNKNNCQKRCVYYEEEPDVVDGGIDFLKDPVLALMSKQSEKKNSVEPIIYKFTDTLNSDEKMCTMTGLATLQILDTILELVRLVHGNKFDSNDFSTRDKIILTYMKLKHNLSYRFLAIIFQVNNPQKCQKIFKEMILTLSIILSVAIPWPSVEEVHKNLPTCFKGFEDTRIVLDCTESFVQSSSNLCCQLRTYSWYKHAETVKFMIGVSPAGVITFISKAYGGRDSDTVIFSQSKLVNMLEPHDAVMMDKGFLISELCIKNRWKLHRPLYLERKKPFTKQESTMTARIAAARVHVERVNQRIKAWAIGGSKMPASLIYIADEIMMVLCGTVNISNPVLADDKFIKI